MAVRRMRIACWIPKATDSHSECVTNIAFPLQPWLHERFSMLHYSTLPAFLGSRSGIVAGSIHLGQDSLSLGSPLPTFLTNASRSPSVA